MLPDFLDVKRVLAEKEVAAIGRDVSKEPLLAEVGEFRQHEGDRLTLVRADGSIETLGFERVQAGAEISAGDIRTEGLEAIKRFRDEIVEQFRETASRMLLDTVGRATEEVGNVVHGGGKPLTAELMLELYEKLEFSFGPDGDWKPPTIVIHPSMGQRVRQEFERLETDPGLRSRMDELLRRKREEWRVREANRKLVD